MELHDLMRPPMPARPAAAARLPAAAPSPSGRSAKGRGRGRGRRWEQQAVAARCLCLEAVVANTFRLTRRDLRGSSRGEAPVAFARQVAMYVAHVWFAMSLTEVGRRFERDRTTVAHACRVVEDRRDDPRIDRVVAAIESAADLWLRLPIETEGGE